MKRVYCLKGINTPGVEAIKHEQEDDNDQPQIGKATLFLSGKLLLVNFCEAVNEGDRQYVGDENGCHRLKEGYRASGVLQRGLLSYGSRLALSLGWGVPAAASRFLGQGSGAVRSPELPESQLRALMDVARDFVATEHSRL